LTRLPWRRASVREMLGQTPRAKSIVLGVDGWPGHRAGQHVDVRLTAADGYQAQRSYSIASAPEEGVVELGVERIDDGEVSPYLVGELSVGDTFEIRGPIGGHFTWSVDEGGPLLLVGGGSGIVPLMAMLRHRRARGARVQVHALVSARSADELLYADELTALEPREGLRVTRTYTRRPPPGWTGWSRRIDEAMLADIDPDGAARAYVCGSTGFVERASDLLVAAGRAPTLVRTERFGVTGG
jgi:ferredoxin-NADP reductase